MDRRTAPDTDRAPDPAGGRPTPRAGEAVALLEGVRRRYAAGSAAVTALDGIDLRVEPGDEIAVVGPSGCGKSTLLNLIAAVDVADEGRAVVCGVDLARASERELTRLRRHSIGVVFQAFHLMPNLTAEENVALPLALAGRRDPARVRALLERVGLEHRLGHSPARLSGGEKQRVAVARALVHRPALVVADEPTGNLDSHAGASVLELLRSLRREEGAALVLATHDAEVAARAPRVVRMLDGRIAGEERT